MVWSTEEEVALLWLHWFTRKKMNFQIGPFQSSNRKQNDPVGSSLRGHILCTTEMGIGVASPDKLHRAMFAFLKLPTNTLVAKMPFQPVWMGSCLHEAPQPVPLEGGEGAHRGAAAGIEEEVGGVGGGGRLVGDGPVAQCHAHDGSHVGLRAKHVDGDPCGLPCGITQEQSASSGESSTKVKRFTLRKFSRKQVEETRCKNKT